MPFFYISVNDLPILSFTTYRDAEESLTEIAWIIARGYMIRNPDWRTWVDGNIVYRQYRNELFARERTLFELCILEVV